MKTLRQYLLELPYPYNYLAIERAKVRKNLSKSFDAAIQNPLSAAFVWADTPEEHSFWKSVADFTYENGTSLPELKGDARFWATFAFDFNKKLKARFLKNLKTFPIDEKNVRITDVINDSMIWNDTKEGFSYWEDKHYMIKQMASDAKKKPVTTNTKNKPVEEKIIVTFGGENYLIKNDDLADFKLWASAKKVKDFSKNKMKTISI